MSFIIDYKDFVAEEKVENSKRSHHLLEKILDIRETNPYFSPKAA